MKKVFTLLMITLCGNIFAQTKEYNQTHYTHVVKYINSDEFDKYIKSGVVVVEFNAPFNAKNGFQDFEDLQHCEYYRVCIKGLSRS